MTGGVKGTKCSAAVLMLIDSTFLAIFVHIYAHSRFQRMYSDAKKHHYLKGKNRYQNYAERCKHAQLVRSCHCVRNTCTFRTILHPILLCLMCVEGFTADNKEKAFFFLFKNLLFSFFMCFVVEFRFKCIRTYICVRTYLCVSYFAVCLLQCSDRFRCQSLLCLSLSVYIYYNYYCYFDLFFLYSSLFVNDPWTLCREKEYIYFYVERTMCVKETNGCIHTYRHSDLYNKELFTHGTHIHL